VQWLPLRTPVAVVLGIIGETILSIVGGTTGEVREREIGTDTRSFNRDNVLDRAIGGISTDQPRMKFPAETGTPEQIQHRLVFHNRCWGNKS
jgi:hypothetical protein